MCIKWLKNIFCEKQNSNMNLEHFISESFVQIYDGIRTAQNKISRIPEEKREEKYFPGYINPFDAGGRKQDVHKIEFDIAVTASSTKSNTGKSAIKADILVVGLEVNLDEEKATNQTNSSVTRIHFR